MDLVLNLGTQKSAMLLHDAFVDGCLLLGRSPSAGKRGGKAPEIGRLAMFARLRPNFDSLRSSATSKGRGRAGRTRESLITNH